MADNPPPELKPLKGPELEAYVAWWLEQLPKWRAETRQALENLARIAEGKRPLR